MKSAVTPTDADVATLDSEQTPAVAHLTRVAISGGSERTSVLVCRGCCCGTAEKHPDVDHDDHLARLRAAVQTRENTRFWTVDCLGPCERSNVVVVRSGGSRRWFGELLADAEIDALATWISDGASEPVPASLDARRFDPAASVAVARLLDASDGELADLVAHHLDIGSTWTMGCHGALAEFRFDDDRPHAVRRTGTRFEAITGSGAMRLTVGAATRAFAIDRVDRAGIAVIVLVTPTAASAHPDVTTVTGTDPRPVDPSSVGNLVDLGLGRSDVRFMLRTSDAALLTRLGEVEGGDWRDSFGDVDTSSIDGASDRIIETSIGRIEVRCRTALPDGSPQGGCRTHLLPGELELQLDAPMGIEIPDGWSIGAIIHPASPSLPPGRAAERAPTSPSSRAGR